jgi:hypothetical protein
MVSSSRLNIVHRWSKTKLHNILVNTIWDTVKVKIFWKLVKQVVEMVSMSCFNTGHIGSKTRSHNTNYGKILFTFNK